MEIVKFLLENGAETNIEDSNGFLPADYAQQKTT
ncbi:MAG: hypothetical protein HWD61_09630 [Parachlamydiaceae bacterium]|nr:MAG: hypothetical protein HWD61_09630 [Parachlamydiaceae bacterium]